MTIFVAHLIAAVAAAPLRAADSQSNLTAEFAAIEIPPRCLA